MATIDRTWYRLVDFWRPSTWSCAIRALVIPRRSVVPNPTQALILRFFRESRRLQLEAVLSLDEARELHAQIATVLAQYAEEG